MDSHVAKFGRVSSPAASAPAVAVPPREDVGVEPSITWPHKPCVAITSHADANVVTVGELDDRMICKFQMMKNVNGIIATGVADKISLEFRVEGCGVRVWCLGFTTSFISTCDTWFMLQCSLFWV